jgi:TPR repeat protein
MSCKVCYPPKEYEFANFNEALACFENGDYARAFEMALPFAEQGMTIAQCLVGGLYQTGLGGEMSGLAADKWLRQAGEGGCALAWHNLSTLYDVGAPGIEMNRDEVMECRRKAYERGFDLIAPEGRDKWYGDVVK